MQTSKRSVYTGSMVIGGTVIPISVYKTVDPYELPGEQYHEGCGGKIRQKLYCELHADAEEPPVVYTAMPFGDQLIPIGSEVRNELLNRKIGINIIAALPTSIIPTHLGTSRMMPMEFYEIAPQTSPITAIIDTNAVLLNSLFEALAKSRSFLLLTMGLCGMERYAMLLPNGRLTVFAYSEEVRLPDDFGGATDRQLVKQLSGVLRSISSDLPVFTLEPYANRVKGWLMSHIQPVVTKKVRSRNPKKTSRKEKVKV